MTATAPDELTAWVAELGNARGHRDVVCEREGNQIVVVAV